jgi:hypothetical protein
MVVKVKRRSGAKKKQGSPVGPPAVVRRPGPPLAPTRPATGGGVVP